MCVCVAFLFAYVCMHACVCVFSTFVYVCGYDLITCVCHTPLPPLAQKLPAALPRSYCAWVQGVLPWQGSLWRSGYSTSKSVRIYSWRVIVVYYGLCLVVGVYVLIYMMLWHRFASRAYPAPHPCPVIAFAS